MLCVRRASPCPPLPTLPGAASAVLGWSPGDGCCFRFFVKITIRTYITYQSDISHVRNRLVKHKHVKVQGPIIGVLSFFLVCRLFHLFYWGRVVSQPSSIYDLIYYTVRRIYLPCICAYRVLLPLPLFFVAILLLLLQLLLFVVVCRMALFVAGSLNLIPVFYFCSKTNYFEHSPWRYCRIYGLDLPIHPP